MNTSLTPRPATRIWGFALATMLTLVMLMSVNLLATVDAPAAQMAQGKTNSRG